MVSQNTSMLKLAPGDMDYNAKVYAALLYVVVAFVSCALASRKSTTPR